MGAARRSAQNTESKHVHPSAREPLIIGRTTPGTNDLPRAAAFHDEPFGVIGNKLNAFCVG